MQRIRRQVGPVGPADGAEPVDRGLHEERPVPERLEHRPPELVRQVHLPANPVGELDGQPEAGEGLDRGDDCIEGRASATDGVSKPLVMLVSRGFVSMRPRRRPGG